MPLLPREEVLALPLSRPLRGHRGVAFGRQPQAGLEPEGHNGCRGQSDRRHPEELQGKELVVGRRLLAPPQGRRRRSCRPTSASTSTRSSTRPAGSASSSTATSTRWRTRRSHRTDQEKFYRNLSFYSLEDLRKQGKSWMKRYNATPKFVLGLKTPDEAEVEGLAKAGARYRRGQVPSPSHIY